MKMKMKKRRFVFVRVLPMLLLASFPAMAQQFYTGNGGRGMTLAILEPSGKGIAEGDQWMLSLVLLINLNNIISKIIIDGIFKGIEQGNYIN